MSETEDQVDIFGQYFLVSDFVDRYLRESEPSVTVIVPVIHSNRLWRENLKSFYREIPIFQLLLGNGGCVDDTITVAREFPRVRVLDHTGFETLGFSLRKLIEEVETPWFAYLQSDVYLPSGWFDEMWRHTSKYDWFGCRERHTVMVEYDGDYGARPWAGSQLGRKEAFIDGLQSVEDDFIYRQEDYVLANIVKQSGYVEGKVASTFHYHQTQFKESRYSRRVVGMSLELELAPEEEVRQWAMHGRGIVKYLPPDSWDLAIEVARSNAKLRELGHKELAAHSRWIRRTNSGWLAKVRIASALLTVNRFFAMASGIPRRVARRIL